MRKLRCHYLFTAFFCWLDLGGNLGFGFGVDKGKGQL